MSSTIFYFTGTGNSLKIAKDIAEGLRLSDRNSGCNIVSIAKNISNAQSFNPAGKVGFVFPVYFWGLPQIVDNFMRKINLSNASYIYVIASHGAGIGNGGCIHQAKNIFSQKGIKLNAGFYVRAVDNYILWPLGIPPIDKQNKVHKLVENKVKKIVALISENTNHYDKSLKEYIGPILFGYKKFIKNVNRFDRQFHTGPNCNSCGICVKICPTYNIKSNNGKPEWKSKSCQGCLACLHLCPEKAIEYGKKTKRKNRYRNPFVKLEEFYN